MTELDDCVNFPSSTLTISSAFLPLVSGTLVSTKINSKKHHPAKVHIQVCIPKLSTKVTKYSTKRKECSRDVKRKAVATELRILAGTISATMKKGTFMIPRAAIKTAPEHEIRGIHPKAERSTAILLRWK